MYPEYLTNSDTQDICRRVSELAESNELALRKNCLEVSRQTDTSSLAFVQTCKAKIKETNDVFANMMQTLDEMSQSLSNTSHIFETPSRQSDFSLVCRLVVQIEEARRCLLSSVAELTQLRRALASDVANANRVLHFLSHARRAVFEELRAPYAEAVARVECAYERLTKSDFALSEVQKFYMTLIEAQLPAFMERLRSAADFNRAGEALDRAAIRVLCGELLILQNCVPNVSF